MKTTTQPDKNMTSFNYMKVLSDFDIIKSMRFGSFSSSLILFDMINRTYTSSSFSVKQLPQNTTLNSNLAANEMTNRLGKTLFTVNENMVKFMIMKDSDPTANPLRFENWLPQTASRLGQLQTFKMVVTVPGDILLKAGAIINIVMPQMQVQTSTVANDSLRTGKCFVSAVHHKFIQDHAATILELLSDTVSAPMLAAATGSSSLQSIVAS